MIGAGHRIVGSLRIRYGASDFRAGPNRAIREHDLVHGYVRKRFGRREEACGLDIVEVIRDLDRITRSVNGNDKVEPASGEGEIVGIEMREADGVEVARRIAQILDHILPEARSDHIGVRAFAALQRVVAGAEIEELHIVRTGAQARARIDLLLRNAESNGRSFEADGQTDGFIGRHDIGEEERVAVLEMRGAPLVIHEHRSQDRGPGVQVRLSARRVARRGVEHRLEHGHELLIRQGPEAVGDHIVLHLVECAGEGALCRQAKGEEFQGLSSARLRTLLSGAIVSESRSVSSSIGNSSPK